MDFYEVVEGRRTIQHFTGEDVLEDDIRGIVRIGTLAPNAGSKQQEIKTALSCYEKRRLKSCPSCRCK